MIDAIEAYNMMPSVIKEEEYKEEILKEIENKIIEAARQNKGSIIIQIAPYKFKLIYKELEKSHYYWTNLSQFETESEFIRFKQQQKQESDMLYSPRYNVKNHEYEFFYHINWDFNI